MPENAVFPIFPLDFLVLPLEEQEASYLALSAKIFNFSFSSIKNHQNYYSIEYKTNQTNVCTICMVIFSKILHCISFNGLRKNNTK